jgi:imidazole glycerol-phosphate synthase subunit HisH
MVAIIDYGAGNTQSVINCLERIQCPFILTDHAEDITQADKIILPGVGHAATAMQSLKNKGLIDVIKKFEKPLLGICLGMQLLYDFSEEGDTECLGIVPGKIKKFKPQNLEKVPHMGWNQIKKSSRDPIFNQVPNGENFYFVHSFFAEVSLYSTTVCDYIHPFTSSCRYNNFYGMQFHPEKSGKAGEQLIQHFLNL